MRSRSRTLPPGNYTVIVNARDDYETAREAVFIDSDVTLSKNGPPTRNSSRRYTVLMTLQLRRNPEKRVKGSVVNAALAEVPEAVGTLYEKGVEMAKVGDFIRISPWSLMSLAFNI